MKKIIVFITLFVISFPVCSYAQIDPHAMDTLRKIVHEIKQIGRVYYQYEIRANSPGDNAGQQAKGEAYLDKGNKLMFNQNSVQTIIYTDRWLYRADHKRHTVQIIDLNKSDKAKMKRALREKVYGDSYYSHFMDSMVISHAVFKDYTSKGDTLIIKLGFPDSMNVKSMEFVYDLKRHMPIRYNVYVVYDLAIGKRVSQQISCYGYSKEAQQKKYSVDNYFSISGDKAVLKKNKDYKLISQL